ncbi:MAG TPA: indole-3-glycerol-phosphate synthase [Gammaproteobacteria bacterium]|nr:indole-3-glycerol-phosphate synthase [Gammaproteobacteria bacterium]
MSAAASTGFLERMAAASRERVRAARAAEPEARLRARAEAAPAAPRLRLAGFDLIAELKLRSPAAGALRGSDFDRRSQLEAYASAGVAAVSVLTEPDEFRGSLAHLREAAQALAGLDRPVMRKDFITDPYQVLEARAAGAGGVLVIVTMLTDAEVRDLVDAARASGLFVLLEAFDERDLERIAKLDLARDAARGAAPAAPPAQRETAEPPLLVGVNCRDLKTLRVDFGRFAALAPHLPHGYPAVAESGIARTEDARAVAELGFTLALVGSSLMQAQDPARAAAELIAAGRAAAA